MSHRCCSTADHAKRHSIKLMSDDEDDSDEAPSAAPTQDEDESMDDAELSDDELA